MSKKVVAPKEIAPGLLKYPALKPFFEHRAELRAYSDAKIVEDLLQEFGDFVRINPKAYVDDLLDAFLVNFYKKFNK